MVKTTQYVRQEKAIASADSSGIRERWLWGLRLLNDAEKMSASGGSLRHGVAEWLIAASGADAKGRNLLASRRSSGACGAPGPTRRRSRSVMS